VSRPRWIPLATLVATIAALCVVLFGVRLNPDVVALLPSQGDAAVLGRYLRGFGGGGIGVLLVESDDPAKAEAAANSVAAELGALPEIAFASARIEVARTSDPLLAWRAADHAGRARLADALTAEGMRDRLTETRKLLLAPGSGGSQERIAADPLRLSEIAYADRAIGAGVTPRADGAFANDAGTAHLVIVKPKGQALRGKDARAFVDAVEAVLAKHRAEGVSLRLTGPHAVAAEMETMLRADLTRSGVLSTVLASLAFVVVFRRFRALLAILPPLAIGTLWTTALAAAWPSGISAIAVAFTSIVVGVGFDTGVHVYAALLDGRRAGLSPREAAAYARKKTARPVLVAAAIAGVAFASLALSSVDALAQLGLLCAGGEVLTAIAIVLITPEIGALIERRDPPKEAVPAYTRAIVALTSTKGRAAVALAVCLVAGLSSIASGVHVSESLVAVRPQKLPALQVENRVFELFGGKSQPWIILVADADRDRALARADTLAETLATDVGNVERVDALTSVLPALETQRARLTERDALDLPAKAKELEAALEEKGFAVARFSDFLDAMKKPPSTVVEIDEALSGSIGVIASRYLAAEGGETLVALHVHLTAREGAREALLSLVHSTDAGASVTGYARLEADLHDALARDFPRIGAVAAVLVLVLLVISLRNVRDVALALAVLATGMGALLGLIGVLKVPLHIYSALVIPVLLGISVDEAMFLLHHSREAEARGGAEGVDVVRATLEKEATPVVTTALTTSAGLVSLTFAQYEGLRDLGRVGAVGNLANLVVALLLVPAGLRLLGRRKASN
jgi:uncharacterized protein